MEELDWIARTARGDEAAFEKIIQTYEKKVYALCLRMCGNPTDAEDAVQEAFLSVWRASGSFRGASALSTWIYRLTVNACIDLIRRRKHGEAQASLDDKELAVQPVDPAPQPQELAERQEMQETVQRGLATLPEEYRSILLLREVSGLSYDEIAAATGLPLGTVKSRINRARGLLRGYLTANGNYLARQASKQETERKEMNPR